MKWIIIAIFLIVPSLIFAQTPRGRVQIQDGTLVTDKGTLLRGAFVGLSNSWEVMPTREDVNAIKDLGLNSIHVYGENPYDPACGGPGCLSHKLDSLVAWTAADSLYLILTIGGWPHEDDSVIYCFWRYYAEKYKDETQMVFEICNEPDNVPFNSLTIDMEKRAYDTIRKYAPKTHILLMSPWNITYPEIISDIEKIGESVDWSNASIAGHGYGWASEQQRNSIKAIQDAGYVITITEFHSFENFYANLALMRVFEQEFISYLNFIEIDKLLNDTKAYISRIEASELRWTPEFGTWPNSISEINNTKPYESWKAGFYDEGSGWNQNVSGSVLEYISNESYIAYYNLDFEDGPGVFEAWCSNPGNTNAIELHIDSIDGSVVGKCLIENTGNWNTYENFSCNITMPFDGIHKIYLVFKGNDPWLFNVKRVGFMKSNVTLIDPLNTSNNKGILLYPNPAKDYLVVEQSGIGFVEIYDIQGKLMIKEKISEYDKKIDVNSLISGNYIIKLISGSQVLTNLLIIE